MIEYKMPRVMWILNHTTARNFEIEMLKRVGVREIFLPKNFPDDPAFRSASVSYSEDVNLTIPKEDLDVLNAADWYGIPGREAWDIANRHFDILFFLFHKPEIIRCIARSFRGAVLWRTYGVPGGTSYTDIMHSFTSGQGEAYLRSIHERFYFAQAYAHLHCIESEFLQKRQLYLPAGLHDCHVNKQWAGRDKRIFFICPDIGCNKYYQEMYRQFVHDFNGLPYTIGGAQSIRVNDANVLGFVPHEIHARNLQEMRVMFYPGMEPNQIHYHPFEAIRTGMPLVFMAGGMLDRLGGENLPGRCKSIKEARNKIKRILNDDRTLIESIRDSQVRLLEPMKPENCEPAWHTGFQRILADMEKARQIKPPIANRVCRIAVIVPFAYRGETLRGAKLLAQAIQTGGQQAGQAVEVVLAHLDDPVCYADEQFRDLPPSIKRRPYQWRLLQPGEAQRALVYAGMKQSLEATEYKVPDDGMRQFMDCDLWMMVSDRMEHPLLPLRPYAMAMCDCDYLQHDEPRLQVPPWHNQRWLKAAHAAERIFVFTEFVRQDAIRFAGLPENRVCKLPILTPAVASYQPADPASDTETDRAHIVERWAGACWEALRECL